MDLFKHTQEKVPLRCCNIVSVTLSFSVAISEEAGKRLVTCAGCTDRPGVESRRNYTRVWSCPLLSMPAGGAPWCGGLEVWGDLGLVARSVCAGASNTDLV